MTRRIIWSVVILVSILVLPYWVYVPLLLAGVVLLPFFWEGILLVFLVNIIHGGGTAPLSLLVSPLSLLTLAVLIVLLPVRGSLRSYV